MTRHGDGDDELPSFRSTTPIRLQQRALFRLLLVIRLKIAKSKNKKSLELWFVYNVLLHPNLEALSRHEREACMGPFESGKPLTSEEWEALLRHAEKAVHRRLARMGFAQAVVEEALLSAVLKIVEKQAAGFEIRRGSMLAYLWRIAYNCAIDLQRRRCREQPIENLVEDEDMEEPVEHVSSYPDLEREVITRSDVNRCLDKLRETDRAIVLHKSYGLTASEIKGLLGLGSEASVNTRYCQACKLLRQCLESLQAYAVRGGRP
jgi:RNA polymerase sigma factor (sigma-70 family)